MSDELRQVLDSVAGLGMRFDNVEAPLLRVEERVEERQDGIREEVTRLRVDVMERLDRHHDLLASFKDDLNVNVASTDNVREKVKSVENDYHQLAHQLSIVHRRLMALESRFDAREDGA